MIFGAEQNPNGNWCQSTGWTDWYILVGMLDVNVAIMAPEPSSSLLYLLIQYSDTDNSLLIPSSHYLFGGYDKSVMSPQ